MVRPTGDNRHFLSVTVSEPHPALAPPRTYWASVDTGATGCAISPRVVADLALDAVDYAEYSSASESRVQTSRHLVVLRFKLTTGQEAQHTVKVIQMASSTDSLDVVLGMDLISCYRLEIHKGHLTLAQP